MTTSEIRKPWGFCTPVVYRYMEQKYVDEFFDTGRLMLSSFHSFSQHSDEQRRDTLEGINVLTGTGENHTLFASTRYGARSLILCTSTRGDDSLMKAFRCDGYFRINNTIGFGTAIASCLNGFVHGLEGFCRYQDQRTIVRDVGPLSIDDLRENPGDKHLSMERMFGHLNKIAGPDAYFVKLRQYSEQCEYRFIWHMSADVKGHAFVTCPEAVKYCERVTRR